MCVGRCPVDSLTSTAKQHLLRRIHRGRVLVVLALALCLSGITSAAIGAFVDTVVARFIEPPVRSFVRTASTLKVVRWIVEAGVLC